MNDSAPLPDAAERLIAALRLVILAAEDSVDRTDPSKHGATVDGVDDDLGESSESAFDPSEALKIVDEASRRMGEFREALLRLSDGGSEVEEYEEGEGGAPGRGKTATGDEAIADVKQDEDRDENDGEAEESSQSAEKAGGPRTPSLSTIPVDSLAVSQLFRVVEEVQERNRPVIRAALGSVLGRDCGSAELRFPPQSNSSPPAVGGESAIIGGAFLSHAMQYGRDMGDAFPRHFERGCAAGGAAMEEGSKYRDRLWNVRFSELCAYRQKNGAFSVQPDDSRQLAFWVNKQRREYKRRERGEKSTLTDERFQALERCGFDWIPKRRKRGRRRDGIPTWENRSVRGGASAVGGLPAEAVLWPPVGSEVDGQERRQLNKNDTNWFKKLEELRECKDSSGSFQIPPQGKALQYWANKQRREHKRNLRGQSSTLSVERFRALEGIGFFDWLPKPGKHNRGVISKSI
uniref:Helicase-associated domain-containing protein n=1 Tax=Odontella aurita TaxID=265563 RepID=A0A7S4N830_9STRA|mmetsp:Transcript_51324/g.154213  ORF Transcript_51324/g.154213 Transcript_51324/m.154213 type:complete len:462 (-) Transcript_51324:41-1426(-)